MPENNNDAIPAPQNTQQRSAIEAENSSVAEAGTESTPAASFGPAATVDQPRQGVNFSRFTPMVDLMRISSNREIILAKITSTRDSEIRLEANQKIRDRMPPRLYASLSFADRNQGVWINAGAFLQYPSILEEACANANQGSLASYVLGHGNMVS